MKECLANHEGTPCPFPVVSGGRCKYHQIGRAYDKDQSIGMKGQRRKKHKKDIKKLNEMYK